jgi:hypothetical protein
LGWIEGGKERNMERVWGGFRDLNFYFETTHQPKIMQGI